MKKINLSNFKEWFVSHDLFGLLGSDRYKSLKRRIVILEVALSILPLLIVVTISYFWFQQILKDDYRNQLKWDIENTGQSIETFLNERLSFLRFLTLSYKYEELSDYKKLSNVFYAFKREFPGIVDIGIIDDSGFQIAYAGPYRLTGVDYSNQNWFNEVVIRSSNISDVYMGYRKIPHFSIAVKKDLPEKEGFWIIRATIDMETLKKYVYALNIGEKDDSFIVNKEGILQTDTRYHGKALNKYIETPLPSNEQTLVKECDIKIHGHQICGYYSIKNTDWSLITVIRSTPYAKIPSIFRNELFFIMIFSILLNIFITTVIAQAIVNKIRQTDMEREEAIASCEHAGKMASIGRLASGVAHEINNPLAIINEKAGLMKDILESSDDLQKNKYKFLSLLNGIFDSITRARTITHRLLGFSRRMDLSHDLFDLNEAIKEVISFIEKEIQFRNINLVLNLNQELPRIETDKGQLQQVILNIINNAIDAVEEDGRIEVITKMRDNNTLRIKISDNGIGIPKDKIKHIFEPFYTTKEKGKGTGLGLSISYGIIQKLGGNISVESEVGKGTTFIIDIPIKYEAI